MVSGEGHSVPERVGLRGADNATNQVLVCLPCAQAACPPGRQKKTYNSKITKYLKKYDLNLKQQKLKDQIRVEFFKLKKLISKKQVLTRRSQNFKKMFDLPNTDIWIQAGLIF